MVCEMHKKEKKELLPFLENISLEGKEHIYVSNAIVQLRNKVVDEGEVRSRLAKELRSLILDHQILSPGAKKILNEIQKPNLNIDITRFLN